MTEPAGDEEFLASYDPRAYDPIAVTVDVVTLTIRDGGLHVLLVQRGVRPYAGQWALPGGFVRAARAGAGRRRGRGRPARRGDQGAGRGDRRSTSGTGAPRAARHLRRARPGPADAGDLGRLPGVRA